MIGLLTEIIGNPTPSVIPLIPQRLIPGGATPNPIKPQKWHFRQSIDYSVSLNYAVLNYALREKEDMLYGIYRMGRNAIDAGNRDNWSLSPKRIDSINKAWLKDQKNKPADSGNSVARTGLTDSIPVKYYNQVLKDPTLRDARGYVIPANQPDFPTAIKFLNALIRSGIAVHKATGEFTVAGKNIRPARILLKQPRPSVHTYRTCSSHRIIPTISSIPGDLPSGPMMPPVGRWLMKWGYPSTG